MFTFNKNEFDKNIKEVQGNKIKSNKFYKMVDKDNLVRLFRIKNVQRYNQFMEYNTKEVGQEHREIAKREPRKIVPLKIEGGGRVKKEKNSFKFLKNIT